MFGKSLTKDDKIALDFWDEYYKSLLDTEIVDSTELPEQKEARIKELEADDEKWFKYYFSKYYTSEPMPFHKSSTNRVLTNPEWYEVRPWSRELSKTGRAMMEFIKLHCTGKKKLTFLLSATKDSAIRLLRPVKLAFEKNQRLRNDYGSTLGIPWKEDEFVTPMGSMFIAVGAGNAPRGAKNEEIRPDSIWVDDYDTDEDCRNPDIVDKKWDFFEQAMYGTRSISNPMLVLWNGNIIADYCCVKKAMEMADFAKIVNIRDKNGKSTWPHKNSEAMIDRVLSKISKASAQKEYFNNPIVLGKVFEKIHYGKIRPLKDYKFLIAYTDPSYKKNGDTKATALVGKWKDEYHVVRMYCGHVKTSVMLDWQYDILNWVDDRVAVYFWIEWPWIDDMLKQEIKAANKRHKTNLPLKPDERDKPEKFFRIESNLEPLNSNHKLIFNEKFKDDDHNVESEFQFKALSPKSRAHDDAPDAVEGAVWKVNHKIKENVAPPIGIPAKQNQKRY